MKFGNWKHTFSAAVVLLAASAWAANKGPLQLQHPTNVGGKTLQSGNYSVQWTGSGDQVELTVFRGKNAVATTSAHVIQRDSASSYDSALVTQSGDGNFSLTEIRFGGKKMALQISGEGGGGSAGAGGPR